MKAVFILLALAGSLYLASGFATVAAITAQTDPAMANAIGFTGIGVAVVAFVAASICIWRAA